MSPYIPTRIVASPAVSNLPTSPVTGMQAWYDCSDVSTLTIVSNKVSQWNDKSGSGFNLTQGTAGSRPLYDAAPRTINGVTVPEFTGAEFMTSSCPADDHTSTTFTVCVLDTVSGNRTLWGDQAGGGNELRVTTSGTIQTLKSGVAVLATILVAPVAPPMMLVQRLGASTIEHGFGASIQSAADSTAFTGGATFKLGMDQSGTVVWDGLIAEVIRYATTLSDSDMVSNSLYLTNKWALP